MHFSFRFALALTALIVSPVRNGMAQTMGPSGTFAVSPTGAATYSIPLPIGDFQGDGMLGLSLEYNSQGGDGILGVGWSLKGLPMIHGCPRTVAQDGYARGIRWDGNDALCLNGQRLVSASGTYGSAGAKYSGEIANFLDITQSAVISVNWNADRTVPFVMRRPTGERVSLGSTFGSGHASLSGSPVYSIPDRVVTPDGRNNVYNYGGMGKGGAGYFEGYYLNALTWHADKENVNGGENLSRAEFWYDARSDNITRFVWAEAFFTQSYRLGRIVISNAGVTAPEFQFGYDLDPSTGRSRLVSISRCNGSGTCLPAIKITYGSARATAFGDLVRSDVIDAGLERGRAWIDFNGDGKADFCRIIGSPGAFRAACTLSTGEGFGQTIISDVLDPGIDSGRGWYDVNGDGAADFCRLTEVTGGQGKATCTLSTPTGFGQTIVSALVPVGDENTRSWVDANADGRADFCRYFSATSSAVCLASNGVGFGSDFSLTGGSVATTVTSPTWAEVPKDSQAIFCGTVASRSGNEIFCNTNGRYAETNFTALQDDIGDPDGRAFKDANDDGLPDYCRVIGVPGQNKVACRYSGQTGVFVVPAVPAYQAGIVSSVLDPGLSTSRFWADVNGDGLVDFCRLVTTGGTPQMQCTLATSAGFGATIVSGALLPGQTTGQDFADFNGDGRPDYCRVVGSNNLLDTHLECLPTISERSLATKIRTGIGHEIAITYRPITDSSIYTKYNDAAYPQRDVQEPIYVVAAVTDSVSPGLSTATQYKYEGLKKDLSGRGSLGFKAITVTQVSTGIATRTEYHQDFPYAGRPSSVTKSTTSGGNGSKLEQQVYSYVCADPVSGGACSIAQGARYFPYANQVVQTSWDLNGAVLPTFTTSSQYDLWGNLVRQDHVSDDGTRTTTTNTFQNDIGNWLLRRLVRSEVTTTTP